MLEDKTLPSKNKIYTGTTKTSSKNAPGEDCTHDLAINSRTP